jgi:hypothetical protein
MRQQQQQQQWTLTSQSGNKREELRPCCPSLLQWQGV